MPLVDVEYFDASRPLPHDVAAFLYEADLRLTAYNDANPVPAAGFVPSNFKTVYQALRAVAEGNLACGDSLCEWGSGFGVVASLAAMMGFNASGIEIDEALVGESRRLAGDYGLPVEFIQGSFIPHVAQSYVEERFTVSDNQPVWLVTDADDAYEDLGLDVEDFDMIFAYPWPGEEGLIAGLFERTAAVGALLLMFDQFDSITLKRKVQKRRRR